MTTYNNVSMACVKCENTVWGCGLVSAAWVRECRKSVGNVREFYMTWRVVTLLMNTGSQKAFGVRLP